ncbi:MULTISPECIES: ABC transporter permease [unclassified Mesorhizobium]|uniref:ABC transporter permease n=1 Tax=unclassified Mesorhizobium TaxID=325217 RepID=UPI001AED3978|nr:MULTISPECIES: ABC transporter permease [unclassified Mesorhizobium]
MLYRSAMSTEDADAAPADLPVPSAPSRWAWILRRLGFGLLALWLVSVLVFAATQVLPGDPAQIILGRDATPARLAALREELGLNAAPLDQYIQWMKGVLTFDLGQSLATRQPVADLISRRAANTMILAGAAAILSLLISVGLGLLAATRQKGVFDGVFNVTAMVLTALPEFVVGIGLVLVFSTAVFHLLPAISIVTPGMSPLKVPEVLVLPVATLVLVTVPYLGRFVRATMLAVLETDYVQMARLKGLSEWRVIFVHAFPNVLVPTIQVAAATLAYLAGGVVVIEYLFSYPGLGQTLVEAVASRDLPVLQAATLLLASVYVALNLIADILSAFANPHMRGAS